MITPRSSQEDITVYIPRAVGLHRDTHGQANPQEQVLYYLGKDGKETHCQLWYSTAEQKKEWLKQFRQVNGGAQKIRIKDSNLLDVIRKEWLRSKYYRDQDLAAVNKQRVFRDSVEYHRDYAEIRQRQRLLRQQERRDYLAMAYGSRG